MKDRIKKIRKELDLTQREFGERIGVKGNTIAQYEMGRNKPIDSVFSLICREFNVNEDWLRNGNGDMFLPVDRENDISRLIKSLLSDESNTFKSRFITMLAGLSVSDWERLEHEAKKLLDASEEIAATNSEPMTVEAAEKEYIKSRSQNVPKTAASVTNTTAGVARTKNKASNQ